MYVYWGRTFICMQDCKVPKRQRILNIQRCKKLQTFANICEKLREQIHEKYANHKYDCSQIFRYLYAYQNFSFVCKTGKFRKTRRINIKHYESNKHSRSCAKIYPKKYANNKYDCSRIFAICTPVGTYYLEAKLREGSE
jgi:hypothetical protein